jgi:hypothetical protein
MFDLEAYRAARRPWSFKTDDGRLFVAKHVSAMDALRFQEMGEAATRARQQVIALRFILRRAFPWRPSYMLRGDPVEIILNFEPLARSEAMADFFEYLWGENASRTSQKSRTHGKHSSTPTQLQSA